MANVSFIERGAAAARRPPFVADRCLRMALISSIGAPQVTSAACNRSKSASVTRRIERLFDQRRTPAGNQKEDQRALVAACQAVKNCPARRKAALVGHGMTADEDLPSRQLDRHSRGNHENSFGREFRTEDADQTLGHGIRGFSVRDGHDGFELAEVD